MYFLTDEEGSGRSKPYTDGNQMMAFCKTWDAPVYLSIEGGKMIMPGEDVNVKMLMEKTMVCS